MRFWRIYVKSEKIGLSFLDFLIYRLFIDNFFAVNLASFACLDFLSVSLPLQESIIRQQIVECLMLRLQLVVSIICT